MKLRTLAAAALALPLAFGGSALASSHREAPFITEMPKVDSTDFYMFRSYQTGRADYVTLIANYQPLQDAYGGPNYFVMDPDALYEIHIDNTGDAVEDLTFQFRFKNELAGGEGVKLDVGGKMVAVPFNNVGAITADDKSKQNRKETFTVKVIRGARRASAGSDVTIKGGGTTFEKPMDNVGTKSFPDYQAYANSFIYTATIPGCEGDAKIFVGQRKEGFVVNLGPIFDLVNAPASVITDGSQRNLLTAQNPLRNKSVTSIAMEIPRGCLTSSTSPKIIGGWQTASLRQARVLNPKATYALPAREGGAWVQVSRLGMPLVNEVVIGIKDKDRFNASAPADDAQFADYVTNPTLPAVLDLLFGPGLAPTVFPRTDLVTAFLTGVPGVNKLPGDKLAEMLRLNVSDDFGTTVTAADGQNNLGAAACFVNGALTPTNTGCDPQGFPNGRRPGDDVVDISLRVAMGYLLDTDAKAPARNVPFHDAMLQDASQFNNVFPYLRTPAPGANGDGT